MLIRTMLQCKFLPVQTGFAHVSQFITGHVLGATINFFYERLWVFLTGILTEEDFRTFSSGKKYYVSFVEETITAVLT